jgi:tetratricopeptide (TPR) repeat protein
MPAALFDTQLLLAETHLEAEQHEAAAELFQALVKEIERAAPTTVDIKGQRALVGAISHDEAQQNAVLVDLAKLVGIEISKVEAASGGTEGAGGALTATSPALAPLREVQSRLLDALYSRRELSVPQLIFIGDACVSLEKGDKARDVYQRVLELIDKDETAKSTAGAATTRIRARLVRLLRSEAKLDEAFKQVETLIEAHPNALEPLMEKGYILQSLSERDPRRLEQCVAHWTDLRLRLGRLAPRPPEYYEVLYNAALCLLRQARHTSSQEKALQAEQMLKSTMTLSPKLSGPDMVAKYEALLKYAATMRSGAAAATSTKSPR